MVHAAVAPGRVASSPTTIMGRPYHSEIHALPATYAWAKEAETGGLASAIERVAAGPLLVVGSGGSLSAAKLAATYHETSTGRVARAVTPLEFRDLNHVDAETSVMLLTAGGSNKDILAALARAEAHEPREVVAMVMKSGSRLAKVARSSDDRTSVFEYPVPFGKDGYLATNSLLGSAVLLARSYFPTYELPDSLAQLLGVSDAQDYAARIHSEAAGCFDRPYLIVLFDRAGSAGASDIETRFSEAALAGVQLADLRNFGHGRHQWLARYGERTAVLCLHSPHNRSLARRTLALVPAEIPRSSFELPSPSPASEIVALVTSMLIAAEAGGVRGVDPGRPQVPEFGRKLYGLSSTGRRPRARSLAQRSARRLGLYRAEALTGLAEEGLTVLHQRLAATRFGGLVADYDGTLVSRAEKATGPRQEVRSELLRLLKSGLVVGIASGRGRSVREDLRKTLPECLWPQVTIGYYNGGQLGNLADDAVPVRDDVLAEELEPLYERLIEHAALSLFCDFTRRGSQLTVEFNSAGLGGVVFETVATLTSGVPGVRVVRSSHSLDVISASVSKLSVIRALEEKVEGSGILAIGDKGAFPGNDLELLQHATSLSVDEESPLLDRGKRISADGERGVAAALQYLSALRSESPAGGFSFVWEASQ